MRYVGTHCRCDGRCSRTSLHSFMTDKMRYSAASKAALFRLRNDVWYVDGSDSRAKEQANGTGECGLLNAFHNFLTDLDARYPRGPMTQPSADHPCRNIHFEISTKATKTMCNASLFIWSRGRFMCFAAGVVVVGGRLARFISSERKICGFAFIVRCCEIDSWRRRRVKRYLMCLVK